MKAHRPSELKGAAFPDWLAAQWNREDGVGTVARFAREHFRGEGWPKVIHRDKVQAAFESTREFASTYTHEIPTLEELRRGLDRAWYEWRNYLGGQVG